MRCGWHAGPMIAIARFTVLEAWRGRQLRLVLALALLALGLAEFLGQAAVTESLELRETVLGALLRLMAVMTCALYIITAVAREMQDKGLELVFALPVPRAAYYVGKLTGFACLALVLAGLYAALLVFYAPPGQVLLWALSLYCELLIVTAFALLAALAFAQATPAFVLLAAFYLLARSIAAMELMASGPLVDTEAPSQRFIQAMVHGIALLLPDLGRFTRGEWLAYATGAWSDLWSVMLQTAAYVLLLSAMALFDLERKSL